MEPSDRKKARIRFKQINTIVDLLFPLCPSPAHAALLVIAWRDADVQGRFSMSQSQIGKLIGKTPRHTSRLIADLVRLGAIRVLRREQGRRPPIYKLTFRVDALPLTPMSSLNGTHNHIEG